MKVVPAPHISIWPKWLPWLIGAALTGIYLARVLYFLSQPDETLVGIIPDDAFYYIRLAQNRLALGLWTFDGHATTTGFHPLYAYFMLAIEALRDGNTTDWRFLFGVVGVSAALCFGGASILTIRAAQNVAGDRAVIFAALPFLTPVAISLVTVMMESQFVVVASAASLYLVSNARSPRRTVGTLAAFLVGMLGSLSRTDFGMLPAALFLATLVAAPQWHHLRRTATLLAGAVTGLAMDLTHNFLISGEFLQSSARIKLHWSELSGHDPTLPLSRIVGTILPLQFTWNPYRPLLLLVVAAALLTVSAYAARFHRLRGEHNSRFDPVVAGSVLTLGGYIAFYSLNSGGLQLWYNSTFIPPLGIVIASAATALIRSRPAAWLSAILAGIYLIATMTNFSTTLWPWQSGMMHAGEALRNDRVEGSIGTWNAGIVAVASGRQITNLDGLVNDEAVPYIESDSLFDYVNSRNLQFIAEHEQLLSDPSAQRSGGFTDGRLTRCFRAVRTLDHPDDPEWAGRMVLFERVPGCQ